VKLEGGGTSGSKFTRQLGDSLIHHSDPCGGSEKSGEDTTEIQRLQSARALLPFDPSDPAAGLSKTALALARMLEVQIQGQVKQAGKVKPAGPAGPAGQAGQPEVRRRSSTSPTTSSPHQPQRSHQHQHDHQHKHQHYYAPPPPGYLPFMVRPAAAGLPHYMPPGYYSGPLPEGHPGRAHGGCPYAAIPMRADGPYAGSATQGGIAWPAGVPSSAELHRRQLQWHHHQYAQQHHLMYAPMHGASNYPGRAGLGLKTIPKPAQVLAQQSPSDTDDAAAAVSSLMGQLAGPPPQQQDAPQAPPSPQQQEQQGQKRDRDMPEKEQEKTQDGKEGQPENPIEGGSLDLQQCLTEHRTMWFNVSTGGSDATIALLNMLKCEECGVSLQGSTNSTACAQCGWALCKDCQGIGPSKRAKLVGGGQEV
jgi:hypothetical protein